MGKRHHHRHVCEMAHIANGESSEAECVRVRVSALRNP